MKKLFWRIMIGLGIALAAGALTLGLKMKPFLSGSQQSLDAQATAFLGRGGNSLVLISEDKQQALIVDTKMGGGARRLKAYLNRTAPQATLTLVNTHNHTDHTQGNRRFPQAHLIAGDDTDEQWKSQAGNRLPDERVKAGEEKIISIGSEQVHIRNMGRAHTLNDVVVYLENRKILVTGDLVFNGWHPALIRDSGTNTAAWTAVLENLIQRYPATIVIPGHGPVGGPELLTAMRDYFASIRAALNNPAQLAELEKKYQNYFSLPFMSGFEKTVKFMQSEEQK